MKIKVKTIFKERVESSGIKKKFICSELNITPQWFARLLKSEQIEVDTIYKVGIIIDHDFSVDFPELSEYNQQSIDNCQLELKYLLKRHLSLLQEHKELLMKFNSIS